ncbi:MAG TPA: serine/threonine protein kinase, partial [Verrucomicrobiae bacterium]
VMARPPSQFYRLQKMVRRNKIVFISAAAVMVALLLGLGSSTWLFIQERKSRLEAERGRANEIKLRQHAQTREKIAQATAMIAQNQFDQADHLVSEISDSESVFDGASVFRLLGEQAATQGQWKRAADRFNLLWRADQMETKDNSSLDCTRCAVVLIELGDGQGYEQFRHDIIKRFDGTPDPLSAERAVKNCLLLPADEATLARLAPFAEIAAKSIKGRPSTAMSDSWRGSSVAIIEFRRGHWNEAIEWSQRSMSFGDKNSSREAMLHAILAMSYYHCGQPDEAQMELDKNREAVGNKFKNGISGIGFGDGKQGYWFDWMVNRILQKEAEELIEGQNSSPDSFR